MAGQFLKGRGGRRAIEIQHAERGATGVVAAEGHCGDVHFVAAQQRADQADDAGLVMILIDEQHTHRRRLDLAAVERHEARAVGLAEQCARCGEHLPVGAEGIDLHQLGVVGLDV